MFAFTFPIVPIVVEKLMEVFVIIITEKSTVAASVPRHQGAGDRGHQPAVSARGVLSDIAASTQHGGSHQQHTDGKLIKYLTTEVPAVK